MSEVTIAQLEARKEELKQLAELSAVHERLVQNPDFRELILNRFMKLDCARYAQESADPLLTPAQRADALAMAQAAGHLKRYLHITHLLSTSVMNDVNDIDDEIQRMRAEGAV